MHPVIKHILARKGQQVPVNDGHKIVLILFGGALAGVRGAGAVLALQQLGLNHAFDEIYVASAGFPNASYLLSGNVQDGISIYYDRMVSRRAINFWRFWKMLDLDYILDAVAHDPHQKIHLEKILAQATKIFVRVYDHTKRKTEYIEAHTVGRTGYFKLMHATCALPVLFPSPVLLRGDRLRDGGFLTSQIIDHYDHAINHSGATDVLAIFNTHAQIFPFQRDPETTFEIFPPSTDKLTPLTRDSEQLRQAGEEMVQLILKTFHHPDPDLTIEPSSSLLDAAKEF